MGTLYVVGTPIGNLEDLTGRAYKILNSVDLIACEDTRHTKILLDRYEIIKPLISYHQHSKITQIIEIIETLKLGKDAALVTDAGTPGICDPGGILVEAAIKENIKVVPIPGPTALASLLSVCGIKSDRFLFLGFLPQKKGRQTLMKGLMKISGMDLYDVVVLYESPYRILRTLTDLQLFIGNKYVIVGRELTKKFEEVVRGNIADVIVQLKKTEPRGEYVVVMKAGK